MFFMFKKCYVVSTAVFSLVIVKNKNCQYGLFSSKNYVNVVIKKVMYVKCQGLLIF